MIELKRCPFCGNEVRLSHNENGIVFVRCAMENCDMTLLFGASDVWKSEQAVARMWNRRAGDKQ